MNTTRTTTAKLIQTIGDIAAVVFWITAALICAGFVVILFTYDTPAAYRVGQVFALVAAAMFLSIGVMVHCSNLLKFRGER